MSDVEVAWLAGLLEGEGSFTLWQHKGKTRIIISLQMTDKDVVEKARNVAGLGNVWFYGKRKQHHKDTYKWAISSKIATRELMEILYPYMGARRQVKIKECLTACGRSVSGST